MKAVLFCLLNFSICSFAQARTYHSFMHDTAVWDEADLTYCCDPVFNAYLGYRLKYIMMDDTTINDHHYKKIFRQVYNQFMNNVTFCYPWAGNYYELELAAFAREDSSGKVFFLTRSSDPPVPNCAPLLPDTEMILYDFNLQVGDTVSWKPYNQIVISIDSVPAPNGEFLRRINFDNQQDSWVEGVGSTFAFFGSYMAPPFECGCILDCAEATDLLPPNSPPPCGGIVNAICDLHSERKLLLSPNPFSDFVSLTSPFQTSSLLSVMNSQGQILLKKTLQPFEKLSFFKNQFPLGDFIFFRLISDEGASQSGIAVHIF